MIHETLRLLLLLLPLLPLLLSLAWRFLAFPLTTAVLDVDKRRDDADISLLILSDDAAMVPEKDLTVMLYHTPIRNACSCFLYHPVYLRQEMFVYDRFIQRVGD